MSRQPTTALLEPYLKVMVEKQALQDTMRTLPADWRIAMLETLTDIDSAADLEALGAHASAR